MDKPSPAVLQALIYFHIKDGSLRDHLPLDQAINHAEAVLAKYNGITEDEFAVGLVRLFCRKLGLPPP
jgi:hypothetical protein